MSGTTNGGFRFQDRTTVNGVSDVLPVPLLDILGAKRLRVPSDVCT